MRHHAIIPTDDHQTGHINRRVAAQINLRQGHWGTTRYYVYTYPSRKAIMAVTRKVKTLCRRMGTNQPLDALLLALNQSLRGWCAYFRPGVSHAAFKYLSHYAWARV